MNQTYLQKVHNYSCVLLEENIFSEWKEICKENVKRDKIVANPHPPEKFRIWKCEKVCFLKIQYVQEVVTHFI